MDVIGAIVSVIIAIVIFAIKNWVDLKAAKKSISKLVSKYEEINADDKVTDAEKQAFAEQVIKTFGNVVPVLTSIWKFNWKKKREIKDVIGE